MNKKIVKNERTIIKQIKDPFNAEKLIFLYKEGKAHYLVQSVRGMEMKTQKVSKKFGLEVLDHYKVD